MSQTPIYDELVATLASTDDTGAITTGTPARAKNTGTRTGARSARATGGEQAAESSTTTRKNRRHRADP